MTTETVRHDGAEPDETDRRDSRWDWETWSRRLGTVLVAAVAAYASYQHQQSFAVHGGADDTTARLWPLSVDGLLVLATAGLLRDGRRMTTRARYALRAAFAIGIIVSLAANIATAPAMTWAPILVAGWPPVALLLAVELLGNRRAHERETDTSAEPNRTGAPGETARDAQRDSARDGESAKVIALAPSRWSRRTAENAMWDYYRRTVAAGLPAPTGAELDRITGTNNYGRAVLRRWQRQGRISRLLASHKESGADTATVVDGETGLP